MISVCIATYNGEKYIEEQLHSILKQLSKHDEVIISDDRSCDETLQIIKNLRDNRIKVYTNQSNSSVHHFSKNHYKVTSNFENALNHAKGDYIFLSDQDDIWMENKVEKCLKYLQNNDFVLSNRSIINAEGKILEATYNKTNPIANTLFANLVKLSFPGCCMAFRRNILKDALPFPENLIMHDGWIFLLAFAKKKRIVFIDEPLIKYRRHLQNVSPSAITNNNPLYFKIWYRFILYCQLRRRLWNTRI